MATSINRSNRKRKSTSELVFEVNENDCSPSTTPEPENTEESATCSLSEVDTSSVTSITKNSVNSEVREQAKVQKLDVDLRCTDMDVESLTSSKPLITVSFRDEESSSLFKGALVQFLKSLVDFELTEESSHDLEISFWEKTIHVEEPPSSPVTPPEENLFTVDTTPSKHCEYLPKYFSNSCPVIDDENKQATDEEDTSVSFNSSFGGSCFNCGGNHSLRNCKKARDYKRINTARFKYQAAAQQRAVRYHLDEDQKYSHLVPGKISDQLRRAMRLLKDEIPPYVYKMRIVGYPPGWLQEASYDNSKLEIFGVDSGSVNHSDSPIHTGPANHTNIRSVDPDKIIEYPGFNVPMKKGVRDDFKYYDCPPFTKKQSKEEMMKHLEKTVTVKSEPNTKTPLTTPQKVRKQAETESDSNSQSSEIPEKRERSCSPTLTDLELRKKQLLRELEKGEMLDSPQASRDSSGETPTQADSPSIVSSVYGTPVLKSTSPYARLPKLDNFSEQISQVINFENLPNYTGKYENMSKILHKVRGITQKS